MRPPPAVRVAEYNAPTAPPGRVVAVTTGTRPMAMENDCAADVAPALSLTVTLKLNGLPTALVGVPLIPPVAALRLKPGGSDPATSAQLLYGGVPPPAVRVAEYNAPTAPPGRIAAVTTGTPPMAMENDCAADVAPALSLTVTLKLNGLPTALVGVPLIPPVVALRLKPGGGDPATSAQLLYGGVPPPAVRVAEYNAPTAPPGRVAAVTTGTPPMAIDRKS